MSTPVSGLLISCATPAARRPTEASLSACVICRWASDSRAVMALKARASSPSSLRPPAGNGGRQIAGGDPPRAGGQRLDRSADQRAG